jgi:hypothetical protein
VHLASGDNTLLDEAAVAGLVGVFLAVGVGDRDRAVEDGGRAR